MKLDDVLVEIGEFGRYQKRVFFLLCLPMISVGSLMILPVLLLYTPLHRCKIPGMDNDTFAIQDHEHAQSLNRSIPHRDTWIYDKCQVYSTADVTYDIYNRPLNASVVPCKEWVYDTSVFMSTFSSTDSTTEWSKRKHTPGSNIRGQAKRGRPRRGRVVAKYLEDRKRRASTLCKRKVTLIKKRNLVCGDMMKPSHAQMLFFLGVLVGDCVMGAIGDAFGRRKALYIGFVTMAVSSIATTWAPDWYTFTILQFIAGGSSHGAFVCAAVIGPELVGPSKRVWTGILPHVCFCTGLTYVSGLAYFFRDWRFINLACAVPTVLYLLYWWFIPESARWLLNKGRLEEFEDLLRKAAKANGRTFPDTLFKDKQSMTLLTKSSAGGQERLWHLFISSTLLKRVLLLCFSWFVVSMTFYGVTLNAGNMSGNFFLNFFLLAVAGFPGFTFSTALVDKLGRRRCNSVAMCVGGAACLCTIFTIFFGGSELQPLTITLAVIGRTGTSAAFSLVYLFTSELLPTVVRNAGMGLCSAAARVGAMAAPYIAKSGELIGGKLGQAEPLLIFGAMSVLAGLSLLLLPETLNKRLPDTILEVENSKGKEAADKTDAPMKVFIDTVNEIDHNRKCDS